MSKIAILLCFMVVASLNASAEYPFEVVEYQIKFDIESGLRTLETEYISMVRIVQENKEKLLAQYNLIIIKIRAKTLRYAVKAWEKLYDIKLKTPEEYDIKNNCTSAFKQMFDKFSHWSDSARRCAFIAVEHMHNNTYVSKATAQYKRAYSDLIELKEKPLCSSQYDKTTELELIETCNEMVNEEINKHAQVFAKIEDTKNHLPTLQGDVPNFGNDFDITAYRAEVDARAEKAKSCYEQCQLEEQLQTSAAAK